MALRDQYDRGTFTRTKSVQAVNCQNIGDTPCTTFRGDVAVVRRRGVVPVRQDQRIIRRPVRFQSRDCQRGTRD